MSRVGPLRLSTADGEALSVFARAYLHEDTLAEYGSAAAAAAAFATDANADERRQLTRALARLIDAARGRPAAALQRYWRSAIRAAWTPQSVDDLAAIARAVDDTSVV